MKAIKFTGLFLAIALLSVKVMAQTEELKVPLTDPGRPYKLSVSLVVGSITVTQYDGKEVIIEAKGDGPRRRNDEESRNGMKRLNNSSGLDITAKEKNNQVTIGSDVPMRNTNLNIKVPQGLSNLKLDCVNNGAIVVNGVNGDIEVSNINGSVHLNDVSGSVVASSINGSIKASFRNVDSKAPMAFSTLNGSIDVTFPANLRANVKLKSDRGGIYTDFDVTADRESKVDRSSKDGMYRIRVDETVTGKINGGGPEVMMKTMNGSLYLHKAK